MNGSRSGQMSPWFQVADNLETSRTFSIPVYPMLASPCVVWQRRIKLATRLLRARPTMARGRAYCYVRDARVGPVGPFLSGLRATQSRL